jgi:iron complex outermembrane receptor protein
MPHVVQRLCIVALLLPLPVHAADEPPDADVVLVTAARSNAPQADLPASTDVVSRERIAAGQLQVNLSEALGEVAGVSAQQRQNYAQDLQLSVRGFGARSSFGVRGVRLYTDGIPATLPDGQGQFSHFDLASAGRVEVIRGPFSVLYGNAAGGVIALYTREPDAGTGWRASAGAGSHGLRRLGLEFSRGGPGASYLLDVGRFETSGYREHGAARRDTLNGRARWQLGGRSTLTLVANVLDLPEAQDPLGLTRAQLAADPRQAGTNALAYDARKSVGQQQLGAGYAFDADAATRIEVSAYGGQRTTRQFQAIPRASQAAATHPGGVIDLQRRYRGVDARVRRSHALGDGPARARLEWTAGVAADGLDEARRGFVNYSGTELGVIGAQRRADANRVLDLDEYLQAQLDAGRWLWLAGARHSDVRMRSRNGLLAGSGASPDAIQGDASWASTSPVAGVTLRLPAGWRAWATTGRGFETPTLNDVAYRSTDGSVPGLNLALRAATSRHYELGLRRGEGALRGSLAVFQVDTRDELAVLASAGGRTVYQNIPSTRRRGAELELAAEFAGRYSAQLAYTALEAVTRAGYGSCVGLPCAPVAVRAGSRMAAVPAGALGARFTARFAPVSVTLESQLRSRITVNDIASDAAGGYALFNLHAEFGQQRGGWRVSESLRIDNLLDRRYVGSVVVNDANGRYFEPEPGRAFALMLQLAHAGR